MDGAENPEKELPTFESYPAWTIVLSLGLSLSIYALGSAIVVRLGWLFLAAYLLLLVYLEVHQLAKGCVDCVYYGRACFSGKGVVAAWLFKRGDPSRSASREASWPSLLPDMLVVLIPLGAGLFLSIRRFDWFLLPLLVALLVLAFPGNGFVRSRLACCRCRQRELGCAAEKLFQRRNGSARGTCDPSSK